MEKAEKAISVADSMDTLWQDAQKVTDTALRPSFLLYKEFFCKPLHVTLRNRSFHGFHLQGSLQDDASTAGLDRRKSIEELLSNPDPLEITKCSLSLKVVLLPLIEEGWDPDNYGMHKLFESATGWLKGLSMLPPGSMSTLSPPVEGALQMLMDFERSIKDLELLKKTGQNKMACVSRAAEGRFRQAVQTLASTEAPDVAETKLQKQKAVIENWAGKLRQEICDALSEAEAKHESLRQAFESEVQGMVRLAHKEVVADIAAKKEAAKVDGELFNQDDELIMELEKELVSQLNLGDTRQEVPSAESAKIPEAPKAPEAEIPKGSVTEAFCKVQAAIQDAMKGTDVEHAVGAVMQSFKNALNEGPKDSVMPEAPQPVQPPPEGVQTAVPPPEGHPVLEGLKSELRRGDTTINRGSTSDLEQEELELAAVIMPDGSTMYRTSKGKLETLEQRRKRIGHNSYVKFSRTFDSYLHEYGHISKYMDAPNFLWQYPKQDLWGTTFLIQKRIQTCWY